MNHKIYITIIAVSFFLISCNDTAKVKTGQEDKENHSHPENVVLLNEKQEQAINMKLGTLQKRNLTTAVKVTGQLNIPPERTAEVSAIIGGNVKSINVFNGDKVRKGSLLAVLEHPDYITLQENFAVTAHRLEYLKQEYKRQKELYDKQVGSGKEYQKAKAGYFTAKVKYNGLKERLLLINLSPEKVMQGKISNTINIISPINGYVNEVKIKLGTYVDPKDIMFEISDNSAIHADFIVYEKDIDLVKTGQLIHFTVANRTDKEYVANIFAVENKFNSKTRAIHIHAKINGDVTGLVAGMYITGHIHTDKRFTTALPDKAIIEDGGKSYIFVLNNYGHTLEENDADEEIHSYKMVEVIPGVKDNGFTEVYPVDSISKDDRIVLNAAYYLLADLKKEEAGDHD